MIWLWITAAVVVSWLLCRGKVSWYHYIWIFLPIEMYGISIAGATIKPYMVFGAFIIIDNILKQRKFTIPKTVVFAIILLALSDCFTGLITVSIMQHLMFILILLIGCNYIHVQKKEKVNLKEISDVTIAVTIGYGVIFTIGYLLYSFNVDIGGLYTDDRYTSGMILRFLSSGGMITDRFRGFCIDPNSVVCTLIPGASFALANILYRKRAIIRSLFAVCLYFLTVYYSGSRMGLICSLIMVFIMFIIGYRETRQKQHWIMIGIAVVMLVIIFSIVNQRSIITGVIQDFTAFFNKRETFTGDESRFYIWKINLKYLFDHWKFIFGVGQNQIYLLTGLGKACHNTWLEWICGTGIFIGLIIDLWFILAPFNLIHRVQFVSSSVRRAYLPLILAYITVIICITTVDNITNSVLLFLALIFRYGRVKWTKDEENL